MKLFILVLLGLLSFNVFAVSKKCAAITKDNISLSVDGVLYFRVLDPYKAVSPKNGYLFNLGSKNSIKVSPGDKIIIKTPGGGGYGNINELKDKTNKIKNSYPWVWFHSNENKRNLILKDFVKCSCENN